MDLHQSENYANYMRSLGWKIEKVQGVNVFIKKVLFFSLIKIQRYSKKLDLTFLKKYWPILTLKLEPLAADFIPQGFKKDSWNLLPTKTIVLDLKNFKPNKNIRYEIRRAEKAGVVATVTPAAEQKQLLQSFIKSWHQHAVRRGFWVPFHKEIKNLAQSFGQNASLIMTYSCSNRDIGMSQPIAGALVVTVGNTANYMYAFSTKEGREVSAPYLVLSKIIDHCQKKKIRYLDLQGIYDERFPHNNKKWQGFTRFKKQWGGKEIEYPGSWSS